jgi:hypothetical protein
MRIVPLLSWIDSLDNWSAKIMKESQWGVWHLNTLLLEDRDFDFGKGATDIGDGINDCWTMCVAQW